ncbi:MAG: hypothetical protein JRH06_10975 [Deltaproteobacteria bacterium]|nr:hypothetical protein [Deltaproteobacteria bacterium]MBW2138067.1 hypothetical protein [Deltaproteobacteria bacterium]
MALGRNVTNRAEMVVRIILGIILVVLGFSLKGYLRPASIVVGVFLVLTTFVGY